MLIVRPFDKFSNISNSQVSLFLAGGSTKWRETVEHTLECNEDFHSVVILDPYDENYSTLPNTAWEAQMMKKADCIVFWFTKESVCPVSLFELGYALRDHTKDIIIGVEPGYPKEDELDAQLITLCPKLVPFSSLEQLTRAIELYVEDTSNGEDAGRVFDTTNPGGTD